MGWWGWEWEPLRGEPLLEAHGAREAVVEKGAPACVVVVMIIWVRTSA